LFFEGFNDIDAHAACILDDDGIDVFLKKQLPMVNGPK